MKRPAGWRFGAAGGAAAIAAAAFAIAAPPEAGSAPPAGAPRYACVETATEAELRVDLGGGEGGAWRGDLTLTILGGTSELSGTVFDMVKASAKGRKPPKLRLKAKSLSDAQRVELLRAMTEAATKAEEGMDCDSPVPHSAKLSWSCANGSLKTGGEQSFEGDRCGSKAKGYARAVGISDWAVAVLKRHGGR